MESQNHLIDAVDSECIDEDTRIRYHALAQVALQEVTGLLEYLQSPEALRNARRARERRIASRQERHSKRKRAEQPRPSNVEPRTLHQGPEPNPNLNTNQEVRTRKGERHTCQVLMPI